MKKPLKTAAICGILSLTLGILLIIILFLYLFLVIAPQEAKSFKDIKGLEIILTIAFIFIIVAFILSIFFLCGFIVLARKFNNKLLSVTAWIKIVFAIIFIIGIFILYIILLLQLVSAKEILSEQILTGQQSIQLASQYFQKIQVLIFTFLALILIAFIIPATIGVLFGVGLLKLKEKVALSEVAGILEIVGVFVGLVGLAVYVIEIIMFFKASKKFEKSRKHKDYK